MHILLLFSVFAATFSLCTAQQPYAGTIFFDPDIITAADPSALQSMTYAGRGQRTVFDRRTATWVSINAYLFAIEWNDGVRSEAQVNPEFGSIEAARAEAQQYARLIGQLPYCLRADVRAVWIHQGVQPFGGGNNSILIHTGQAVRYQRDGILEETLVHEASHTSLDSLYATAPDWKEAQQLDRNFISQYAAQYPQREDIAESFLPWLALRHRRNRISENDAATIARTIPHRLAFFDKQNFDLRPFATRTSLMQASTGAGIEIFPHPASETLNIVIKQSSHRPSEPSECPLVQIFSIDGSMIAAEYLKSATHSIDVRNWMHGAYMLVFTAPTGQQHRILWMKLER
jgi:hypothetical protein